MVRLSKILITLFSLGALSAVAFGIQRSMHSGLFIFHHVEVQSSLRVPPYDDQTLIQVAQIPIGKVSLFDLDLLSIEKRLMAQEWIRSIHLQKKVPDTLIISVTYREPVAIVQGPKGALAYVDLDGKVFGKVTLTNIEDLPFLSGFWNSAPYVSGGINGAKKGEGPVALIHSERLKEALSFISTWENSNLHRFSQISSVQWEAERGFRALVIYSFRERNLTESSNRNNQARVIVELGQDIERHLDSKLVQLSKVFQHLSGNSIAARQVWADAGKKIVVKTVRGS